MNTDLIAAALAGGGVSYLLQGIFNIFTSKKEHQRKIKELTHQRKLEVAEYAMSAFNTKLKDSISYLNFLKAIISDNAIDYKHVIEIYEDYHKEKDKFRQTHQFKMNTIELYISLKSIPGWSADLSIQGSTIERDVMNLCHEIINKTKKKNKLNSGNLTVIDEKDIKRLKGDFDKKMEEYLNSIDKYNEYLLRILAFIRSEIK